MNTTTVGPELANHVARLHRDNNPNRTERVLVALVKELGDGTVVIIGDLLYRPGGAYHERDSRGRFHTLAYNLGDTVQIEE